MHQHFDLNVSPWIEHWGSIIHPGTSVLDVASGHGRHSRWFAQRRCAVTAVDRDAGALSALVNEPGITTVEADLETSAWPFEPAAFGAVVVTNYLHRPLFPALIASLVRGGVLLYETFMQGNERYGKPSNPAFLLAPGELLTLCASLTPIAFQQGLIRIPRTAVIQRLVAVNGPVDGVGLIT